LYVIVSSRFVFVTEYACDAWTGRRSTAKAVIRLCSTVKMLIGQF